MFIPFSQLPSEARIWIFQANRPFTAAEEESISARLREFTDEWVVHGTPLETSYQIVHSQFIVLAADESRQAASGCSIDSSVRVLKEIEATHNINLFERSNVSFLLDGRVVLFPVQELKEKFSSGVLSSDTPTFNNLVSTKKDFEERWLIPATDSWLKRYLPKSLENV